MMMLEDKIKTLASFIDLVEGDEFTEHSSPFSIPCYRIEKEHNCYCCNGASKYVIVPEGSSYVLKIPYRGEIDYYYDDDTDQNIEEFIQFTGADTNNQWNYCGAEAIYYDLAIEDRLEKYFAETRYYGKTEAGYPLYIQEKCCYTCPKGKIPSKASKSIAEGIIKYSVIEDIEWIASFIESYGEEEFERLESFLDSLPINDLTYRNVGYALDGRPVLIDFSGFNG